MLNQVVTTGLSPLTVNSTQTFVEKPVNNDIPWDLTGGTATLLLTDPNGVLTQIVGTPGNGFAKAPWTVVRPTGQWLRAWQLTDASGAVQVTDPVPFNVISSPV